MANRKILKAKHQLRAKLLSEDDKPLPCIFCKRMVDDEPLYGKIYALGDIQCHYFCVLLSCCLIQRGKDTEGLFGFLYQDIIAEFERCKKHKCSYCGQFGANLGCVVSQCRKQFHLPCGREKNSVSMFYGNYKSYCQLHAPKQHITDHIMVKARQRMPKRNKKNTPIEERSQEIVKYEEVLDLESVCVICYERVDTYPTINTFWPPCCGKDAWFHRSCLQRMALSAGMHYLKCPLCNDKESFYNAVLEQGYYIPDRDAAWELEQNAFQEIYSRVLSCSVDCKCPNGREYDSDCGAWDMKICVLCGAVCAHLYCFSSEDIKHDIQDVKQDITYVCETCTSVAGDQLDLLLENVQKLIIQDQRKSVNLRRGRVMPSRMSLRRTKQGAAPQPSTSRNCVSPTNFGIKTEESPATNTTMSRRDLNLSAPKRKSLLNQIPITSVENNLLSPLKLLEQGLKDKMKSMDIRNDIALNSNFILSIMRQKLAKPKPLSEKKKIINDILDGLLKNQLKETPKNKTPLKEWNSPKKRLEQCTDTQKTPEKSPIKSEINVNEMKNEISTANTEESHTPNPLLRNLLNDIDNRKNSLIETLFYKGNKTFNNSKMGDIKPIKIEIMETNYENNNEGKKKIENEKEKEKKEKCAIKFNPFNKEKLRSRNYNLDVEVFKNSYLNEVSTCDLNTNNTVQTQIATDFAKKAVQKIEEQPKKTLKRKAQNKIKTKRNKRKRPNTETTKKKDKKTIKTNLETSDEKMKKKKKRKGKEKKIAHLSIRNKNLKLKIKWQEKLKLKLKISDSSKNAKMTQYVLNYAEDSKQVLAKPENNKTPNLKKLNKPTKSPDNLKQTTIQNFFSIQYYNK